jgi:rhamnogalacturonan endolyase
MLMTSKSSTLSFKSIFLPLALIVAMISGLGIAPLFQFPAYAVDGCATPMVITGGGSYTVNAGDTCFKYVNSTFIRGGMFSVMNGADSTVSNVVKWYGGRNETVTACINDSQTLNGNGAQLNNFTVAKDSSSAMYVSITGNKANSVTINIQNWQNGLGCSVAPTLVGGGGPTNTSVPTNTPTNTPVGPTNTPTNTLVGPTPTSTLTRTNTPIVPTNTPTNTPVVPSATPPSGTARQMENLNRGLIRVNQSGNFVSWRLLGTDPANIAFNVYRGATKLNASPITNSTNYFDSAGTSSDSYTIRPVINGVEQAASESSLNISGGFLSVPLQIPPGGTTPDNVSYTYSANDASVGDVDGDGVYEIILKWDPSNAKDNSQSGYTGNVYIDAYKLNGTRLWRIDLGRNIRAGAHYTQFMVYDLDGDGRAEVAMKTADGTVSGTGQVIGNASADYRNSSGYILSGPEYLTVFNGQTGAILATANYEPPRGTVSAWGDSYGNRVDRFLAAVAYLDGTRPSLVMTRGYYTRTVLVAWNWRNGQLTRLWTFDSNVAGSQYAGQGNHNLSVVDADADGKDEIIFGAMAINDNGTALWNTGLGHGDALHVGDLIPSRAGQEVFKVSEDTSKPAAWMADARTGQIIWQNASCGCDNGRGVSGDVWAGSTGAESWSSAVSGIQNTQGQNVGRKPGSTNFLVWWDADPVRELLDATHIDKYGTASDTRLLTGSGISSNNGTKSTPALSADLFGDWREEVMWRTTDSSALRIYVNNTVTSQRIYTLMHNPQYRVAIAWQNVAYNQPPHPSFYLGDGMTTPPMPNIYLR